ncbi:DUF4231 domain-containing protein [Nocardia sp. NPDC056611]|uniref:DUF4231 domain-containing protein n=1 Tax=Nocardia sp. NPDC056611 TaxID=3345877 RepID=UPI00366E74E3
MSGNDDQVVAEIWADRLRWSQAACRLKRRLDRARITAFTASTIGALCTTAAATVAHSGGVARTCVAAVGAVCLALAAFVGFQYLTPDAIRAWTRARATSEGIKRLIFEFRAGAQTSVDALRHEMTEIVTAAADLLPYVDDAATQPTPPPSALTPETYVRQRIQGQIDDYYRPTARRYTRYAARWRRFAIALGMTTALVAAAAAIASGTGPTALAPWVAVLTTATANVAAYLTAQRYDYLAMTYLTTAHRLRALADDWAAGAHTDWPAFVSACESVIATENSAWMAKWTESATAGS